MDNSISGFGLLLWLCAASNGGAAVLYVDAASSNPTPPYTNWASAAAVIQDAIDAANPGDQVVVTNGVYQSGGRISSGLVTNRLIADKPVMVRSINGPTVTVVEGHQEPGNINGASAVRCAYMAHGAILTGFTLTQGATLAGGQDVQAGGDTSGGGILCGPTGGIVSNCVLIANAAGDFGGGDYGAALYNCLVLSNTAGSYGGGTFGAPLNNCTLIGNVADIGAGDSFGALNNCIVYDNAPAGGNYAFSALSYCCTTPDPGGTGNITNAPLFLDESNGNCRLQTNSPCINAGNNTAAPSGLDLDGDQRIVGGAVDIGAFEFQNPGSLISYAWLEQYGFPIDGTADFADPDGDGLNNWQEWIAGTDPTDRQSVLRMLPPVPAGSGSDLTIGWQSVSGRIYFLQRSLNLQDRPPFVTLATNLAGQSGSTSYTDTNAPGSGACFYRVGVQ